MFQRIEQRRAYAFEQKGAASRTHALRVECAREGANDRQRAVDIGMIQVRVVFQLGPLHGLDAAEQRQHVGAQGFGHVGCEFLFSQLALERVVVHQLQFGRRIAMVAGKRLGPGEVTAELVGKRGGQGFRTGVEQVEAGLSCGDVRGVHPFGQHPEEGVLNRDAAALEEIVQRLRHARIDLVQQGVGGGRDGLGIHGLNTIRSDPNQSAASHIWSGRRESNPPHELGKLR